ncbi:MAG: hypothetical protein R2698_11245 [Microthrixaceae bacterium]
MPSPSVEPVRRVRRRIAVLVAFVTSAAIAAGAAPGAAAQARPSVGPRGFVPGEAKATADSFSLNLSSDGSNPFVIQLGASQAGYTDRTADATAAALNLGVLKIMLGPTAQCGTQPPIISEDQLALGDSSTSDDRDTTTSPAIVRSPGTPGKPGGIIGTQVATTSANPQRAAAQTTSMPLDYVVMDMDGAATFTTSSVAKGVRRAHGLHRRPDPDVR